jgi:hypothetical protein
MPELSVERVRELLNYDPETGVFTWRVRRAGPAKAGSRAGSRNSNGYIKIAVDGQTYAAHRLAIFYTTGTWPAADVDHRNGARDDNRLDELRGGTRSFNMQNQRAARSNNSTGLLGVNRHGAGGNRFRARIRAPDGKLLSLGTFDTAEAAHAAYLDAKRRLHEGCTL